MKTRIQAIAFAIPSLLVFACGDGSLVAFSPDDPATTPGSGSYELTITSPQPLSLEAYAVRPLRIHLTRGAVAATDVDVNFAIEGQAGGARLAALRATTNRSGDATVEILAGGDMATFTVLIETGVTSLVRAEVQVYAPGEVPGGLAVQIAYPEQSVQPILSAKVTVHDASVPCDVTRTLPLPTALQATDLPDIAGTATFGGLPPGGVVTVIAVGYNATAALATGCLEGVRVESGEVTEVTVHLDPRGLQLIGDYDLVETFDFSDAIPGRAGTVISTLAEIFDDGDDPGRYLVDIIEDRLGIDFSILKQTVIDVVNDFIDRLVPEKFRRLFEYVGDAARVVKSLTAQASLNVREADDGTLIGEEIWDAIVFTWSGGCDPVSTPGCETHRIALRNTNLADVVATYPVTYENGVMRIARHDRTIEYARFFHLFIKQIVYPHVVPGASTTSEVLQGSIDCWKVATRIDGADGTTDGSYDLSFLHISTATLEDTCDDALYLIGALVDAKLDALAQAVPSTVTLEGAVSVIDSNQDLVPERLENGVFQGGIDIDGVLHPVVATFIGVRRN